MLALPRFTGKIKNNFVAGYGDVPWAQCCDAITPILVRIDLAAGTHKAHRQYPEDAGHYPLARHTAQAQVPADCPSHSGKRFDKFEQSFELLALTKFDVAVVVEVLPASGSIFTDSLHAATTRGVYADFGPR